MVVNDNAGCQIPRGDFMFIASKLAPTKKNPMTDHGVFCVLRNPNNGLIFVGASLLAKAVGQSTKMLNDKSPSSERRPEQARSHKGFCGEAYSGAGWMISTQ
jgi:hypothetical protein